MLIETLKKKLENGLGEFDSGGTVKFWAIMEDIGQVSSQRPSRGVGQEVRFSNL